MFSFGLRALWSLYLVYSFRWNISVWKEVIFWKLHLKTYWNTKKSNNWFWLTKLRTRVYMQKIIHGSFSRVCSRLVQRIKPKLSQVCHFMNAVCGLFFFQLHRSCIPYQFVSLPVPAFTCKQQWHMFVHCLRGKLMFFCFANSFHPSEIVHGEKNK